MKRIAFHCAALALLILLAGCRKEVALPEPPASVSFLAEIGALTRTTLDGVRVQWESGDELDILSSVGVVTYVATPLESDARKAVFTKKNASDPEPIPLPEAFGIGKYAALYPPGLVSMPEGMPVVTLPSTQQYQAPSSLKGVNVMFAFTDSEYFSFQNALETVEIVVAVKNGYGEELIATFKRLSSDELVNVYPHPAVEFLEYNHPGMYQRIRAVREAAQLVGEVKEKGG